MPHKLPAITLEKYAEVFQTESIDRVIARARDFVFRKDTDVSSGRKASRARWPHRRGRGTDSICAKSPRRSRCRLSP